MKRTAEPANADRADRIANVKQRYFKDICDTDDDFVTDLLTDLRHYCDQNGIDFAHRDATAYQHYIEENGAAEEATGTRKHYLIDFVYVENSQQFGSEADLTDAERDELETYLECHKGTVEITDAHIREAGAPVHQDFAKVKAEIKAAIGDNTPA
jgi:hypothetical protein